jgi:lipopolysaccharide transport system permease protein
VKFRDVGIMMPVIVQLWMFLTPIVYPLEIVPERWRHFYSLNPLVGLIEGFRAALLNRPFNLSALLISTAITGALMIYALNCLSPDGERICRCSLVFR